MTSDRPSSPAPRSSIEHGNRRIWPAVGLALLDVVTHLAVREQVVVDVLDALELLVRLGLPGSSGWDCSPSKQSMYVMNLKPRSTRSAQQVEVGGADEVERHSFG